MDTEAQLDKCLLQNPVSEGRHACFVCNGFFVRTETTVRG